VTPENMPTPTKKNLRLSSLRAVGTQRCMTVWVRAAGVLYHLPLPLPLPLPLLTSASQGHPQHHNRV
jgi:hypothetical protein